MSIRALTWALDVSVGDQIRKLILVSLADFADENGQCFPSQQVLADRAECHINTVARALKKLEKDGFITRTKRGSAGGGRTSDLFTLNVTFRGVTPQSAGGLTTSEVGGEGDGVNHLSGGGLTTSEVGVNHHSYGGGTFTEPIRVREIQNSQFRSKPKSLARRRSSFSYVCFATTPRRGGMA